MIKSKLKDVISGNLKDYQKRKLLIKSVDGKAKKEIEVLSNQAIKNIIESLDFKEVIYNTIKDWIGADFGIMAYIDMTDGKIYYGMIKSSIVYYDHFIKIFELEPSFFQKNWVEEYVLLETEVITCNELINNGRAEDIYKACEILNIDLAMEYTELLVIEFGDFDRANIENQLSHIKFDFLSSEYDDLICPILSINENGLCACIEGECGLWSMDKYEWDGYGCSLTNLGLLVPVIES